LGEKLTPEWEAPLKKDTELPKKDSLEKGFINSHQSASSREDGIGLSQIQHLPFVSDHNWEEAWKKVDVL
jgi:hypothetical protein